MYLYKLQAYQEKHFPTFKQMKPKGYYVRVNCVLITVIANTEQEALTKAKQSLLRPFYDVVEVQEMLPNPAYPQLGFPKNEGTVIN